MEKMLKCLLVIRKTDKSSHVIAVMAIRAISPVVSEEVKMLGLAHHAGRNVRLTDVWKAAVPLLGIYPLGIKALIRKDSCIGE